MTRQPGCVAVEDFSALVDRAAGEYWETRSVDAVTRLLQPALDAQYLPAYSYLINVLIAHDQIDRAREIAQKLVEDAKSEPDFALLIGVCESNVFSRLGFDETKIHRTAMLTLAKRGNPLMQAIVALHYLHGTAGFVKNDSRFKSWILKAIESSDEIDPVCYYVEYLLDRDLPVPQHLADRISIAAAEALDWAELQVLVRRMKNAESLD